MFLKAFNYVDSEGSHVISKEDFIKDDTVKVLEFWLGPHEDWEEEFDNIDLTNKKGEGKVLFKESLFKTLCTFSSVIYLQTICLLNSFEKYRSSHVFIKENQLYNFLFFNAYA